MNLLTLFKDKKIDDIWPAISSATTFQLSTTIRDALSILEKNMILSAPVLSGDGRLVGFVDVLDIILYIARLVPTNINWELASEDQMKEFFQSARKFDDTPLSEVIEYVRDILLYSDRAIRVTRNTSITELVDIFYNGAHRVPVMSDDGLKLLGVISQTDLMNILVQCMGLLHRAERTKTLAELEFGEKESLITVHSLEKVVDVLKRMNQVLKKPVSAVPVVDGDGKLIANFSASNLTGLNQANFGNLLLGVYEFLLKAREEGKEKFQKAFQGLKSLHPITCTMESTFQSVVFNMVTNRVHHLWVVDKEEKPVGVVSMTDLFKVFLPWASPLNNIRTSE